jgi:hypothetical protein
MLATLGGVDPSFAGNVGKPEAVLEILKTKQEVEALNETIAAAKAAGKDLKELPDPPNVREQMTLVYNFTTKIMIGELANAAASESKLNELITQGGLSKDEVEKRVAFMKAQAEKRKAAGQKGDEGAPAGQKAWDLVGMVPEETKDNKKDGNEVVAGQEGAGKTTQAVNDQWKARDNRSNVEKSAGQTPAGPASDRTAKDAADQGAPLSDREKDMQGITGDSSKLKWSEGAKMWVINEKDKWVQAMRQLSLPLAAGPSGTTNVLMNANAMLGAVTAVDARVACIGYLLPINAHSLVEICAAAAAYGVPFTAGQKIYRDLAGFAPGELQSCGRDGAGGKKLFPDEPDADVAQSSTGAPASGTPSSTGAPANGASTRAS